ncbi:hypothetical protein M405DRAFT_817665 [Rhizopogon salebrosus TDB-379]|nr:hypothetical protein M405DRAFT_817665 [Rhizopogon salebrosus TDB-379]
MKQAQLALLEFILLEGATMLADGTQHTDVAYGPVARQIRIVASAIIVITPSRMVSSTPAVHDIFPIVDCHAPYQ